MKIHVSLVLTKKHGFLIIFLRGTSAKMAGVPPAPLQSPGGPKGRRNDLLLQPSPRKPRCATPPVGWAWAWAWAETHYIIIITSHRHIQSPTQLFSTARARAAVPVRAVGSLVVVSGEQRPSARAALACANRVGLDYFLPIASLGLQEYIEVFVGSAVITRGGLQK